jgi:hypothetical protein
MQQAQMDSHSSHTNADALRNALAFLLEAALTDNGIAAPALTAITIDVESSSPELCMRLHFANGYEIFRVVTRREARPFCAERGIRTRGELQEALLEEALPIYERMSAAQPEEKETAGQESFEEEVVSILEVGTPTARERGMRLLFRHLTPRQRQQLSKHGHFEVIGGESGRCYRIWRGRILNIDQLDRKGRRVCSWCFLPVGGIVTGDIMLAQKLALQLDEAAALKIAGRERSRSRVPRQAAAEE